MQFDGQHFTLADVKAIENGTETKYSNNPASSNVISLKPAFSSRILMIKPYGLFGTKDIERV